MDYAAALIEDDGAGRALHAQEARSAVPRQCDPLLSFRMAIPLWLREKLFLKDLLLAELRKMSRNGKWNEKLLFSEHHLSHAASAFFPSPFDEAIVLTMDGVGEWATTSAAIGKGNTVRPERARKRLVRDGLRQPVYAAGRRRGEHNPSRRLVERLNFRYVGRMRQCHYIDGASRSLRRSCKPTRRCRRATTNDPSGD